METRNEEQPLKIRSARAVIAAGFRLYMGNFRRIFRTTWLPAVLCAVVSAFYTSTAVTALNLMLATGVKDAAFAQGFMGGYMAQTGLSLLNLIVSILLISYVFHILSFHRAEGHIPYPTRWLNMPDSHTLTRTVGSAVVWIAIEILVGGVVTALLLTGYNSQSLTLIIAVFLLMLVAAVFLLPMVYPHIRFLTTRDTRLLPLLRTGYIQGLRHWGYIFTVLFVMLIVTAVVLTITELPAIVLVVASMKSQAGALMGDPEGMPSYMSWLSFLVFTLSGFIQAYVVIAIHFPIYYMAGSIEQQEKQRNEKTKNTLY